MGEQSVKGQQQFDKMIAKIRATISFLLFSTFQEKRAKVWINISFYFNAIFMNTFQNFV